VPSGGGAGAGGPDPVALAAALGVVPGVVTAWTTCDADGVPVAVRIVLEPDADEVEVAAMAHRILRLQFGVGLDPAHVEVLEGIDPTPGIPSPRLHLVDDDLGRVIELDAHAGAARPDGDAEQVRRGTDLTTSPLRHPARLAIAALDVSAEGSMTTATVTLRGPGSVHTGTAEGWSAATTVDRTIAQATANAVSNALGPTGHLDVEVASVVPVGSLEVVVVQVAWVTPGESERLLGAAEVGDDVRRTVIRATLDAVNRRLARPDG